MKPELQLQSGTDVGGQVSCGPFSSFLPATCRRGSWVLPRMRTEGQRASGQSEETRKQHRPQNNGKESERPGCSPQTSGKEHCVCWEQKHCPQSLNFCVRLSGGLWGLSQVVGTSGFYGPHHLSRRGLLFTCCAVGYLGRLSLPCPGLLNLFPGLVDTRGRRMWLTERL